MDADEALLEHYGIKGMKWGRRRGSSTTGVSRARGALIDRNDRMISRLENLSKGKGLRRDRVSMRIQSAILGKKAVTRYNRYAINEMHAQNARLKSGKATVVDKMNVLFSTTPLDFVLSNRPK